MDFALQQIRVDTNFGEKSKSRLGHNDLPTVITDHEVKVRVPSVDTRLPSDAFSTAWIVYIVWLLWSENTSSMFA